MKKIVKLVLAGCIFLIANSSLAQEGIGIGIDAPDESSILHIQPPSNNRGLLIPRLETSEINGITDSANGLLAFDTDKTGLVYRDAANNQWVEVIPQGMITMWSGTTPPNGWILCDGSNNTPDLRGRFIVGYNASVTDYNDPGNISEGGSTVGKTGGLDEVTLTQNQSALPSHAHTMTHGHTINDPEHSHVLDNHGNEKLNDNNQQDSYSRSDNSVVSTKSAPTGITINNHTGNTGNTGQATATQAHENRPPYYVLAFIMKL
ncbi:MAG: hypothetical protein GY816_13815 [Cytophagales bacterium]|nr:hypothetical protein [Cytophagales bacterium]